MNEQQLIAELAKITKGKIKESTYHRGALSWVAQDCPVQLEGDFEGITLAVVLEHVQTLPLEKRKQFAVRIWAQPPEPDYWSDVDESDVSQLNAKRAVETLVEIS